MTENLLIQTIKQLDAVVAKEKLLVELRDWFANEFEAGDDSLQLWVDKIDKVI